jgi:hypothetical protein
MMYTEESKFVPVVVRGKNVWVDQETFLQMVSFRNERIDTGIRYNTGPAIHDQYADAGEALVSGGSVTVWELGVFVDGIALMQKLFGSKWYLPKIKSDESRPNPTWMKDYYEEYSNG